jgi:hypothetical protein
MDRLDTHLCVNFKARSDLSRKGRGVYFRAKENVKDRSKIWRAVLREEEIHECGWEEKTKTRGTLFWVSFFSRRKRTEVEIILFPFRTLFFQLIP